MTMTQPISLVLAMLLALSCGRPAAPHFPNELALPGSDGAMHQISRDVSQVELTAFIFYSAHCPTMRAHESRLKEWHERFSPRGVRFILVNSETGASASEDAEVARERGYPFLLLTDDRAELARNLGAEFATHAVVVDRKGNVLYSGGLDSDRSRLREDAQLYLVENLDDLLNGRPIRHQSVEAMGCVLQIH